MIEGSAMVIPDGSSRSFVRPVGDLDLASAPALRASVEEAIARSGAAAIVVDLTAIRFMDSTGLRSLLDAKDACTRSERRLVLCNLSPEVRHTLDVVGLKNRFEIVDDLDPVPPVND